MIVLFMVVSFVVGCVDRMCQLFLSECVFFQLSFLALSLWIFDPSLLVGDKFSSQMISGTVSWLLGLDRTFKRSYD